MVEFRREGKRQLSFLNVCIIVMFFVLSSVSYAVAQPDLTATSVSGPTAANTEELVSLNATVVNQGLETAEEYSYVRFYLSLDGQVAGAYSVGDVRIAGLAAGAQRVVSINTTVPVAIPADGAYTILAVADVHNAVKDESDETNNTGVGSAIAVTKL
jgi:hypothetical protein